MIAELFIVNMSKYHQGKFKPQNASKYMGDVSNITYRSSYELKMMIWVDTHPEIHQWSSECIAIPYLSPLDGKYHRYFPDLFIRKKNGPKTESMIIEIKPKIQTLPPQVTEGVTKKSKKYIKEVTTWAINQAKWEAAQRYCDDRKWTFVVINEDHIFGRNKIS